MASWENYMAAHDLHEQLLFSESTSPFSEERTQLVFEHNQPN